MARPYRRGEQLSSEERQEALRELRTDDFRQLIEFRIWWVRRMLSGVDPLRERMTLFWHGHFTSSFEDVRNSHEMIQQNELFRAEGLGSFASLLHDVARDPAMLEYLDNDVNRVGEPNENFARELMELFTLGEGHYTEQDVREVARAFTGWSDRGGVFRFQRRGHDFGRKTVLGESGNFFGGQVLDLLLEQEACPRWIATQLLEYFEGVEAEEARVERYAALLRDNDYEVSALLRALFLDPDFYRDEVVGMRVASPIDYLVSTARKLGVEPPPELIVGGARLLGESLLEPPNVEGWEGGLAWITTSSLMTRANLVGVMLGAVHLEELAIDPELLDEAHPDEQCMGMGMGMGMGMQASEGELSGREMRALLQPLGREYRGLGRLLRNGWRPRLSLVASLRDSGARTDREIVDQLCARLLSVQPDERTRLDLSAFLARGREQIGRAEGALLAVRRGGFASGRAVEELLRETAHLVLCLPEAQLH